MKISKLNGSLDYKKIVNPLSLFVLSGLLLLRLPFITGMQLALGKSITSAVWPVQFFDVGTYLLTAILIWLERKQLEDFHITPLALGMILLFKPVMPILIYLMGDPTYPLSFPRPISALYWIIAFGLIIALRLSGWKWSRISRSEGIWFSWGSLIGLGATVIVGIPMFLSLKAVGGITSINPSTWMIALIRIPQQLGFAAVTEEPLFRGFLWGYLRKFGWKDPFILLFQAVLFMLGHLPYLTNNMPLMFWISIPFMGLVLGYLAWRSRTIVSSMAAHAMMNAFGVLAALLIGMAIYP